MKSCKLYIIMGDRRICALYYMHVYKSDTCRHSRCDPHCIKIKLFSPCLLWWQEIFVASLSPGWWIADGSAVMCCWSLVVDLYGLLTALEGESFSPWTKVINFAWNPPEILFYQWRWNRLLRQSTISCVEEDATFSSGVTSLNIRLLTRMNPWRRRPSAWA